LFSGTGKLRAIGISNYTIDHVKELLQKASVLPAVNQCEFHPHYAQKELAYSSLGSPRAVHELLTEPKIVETAAKYSCSVPQFLLAWSISQGISVLPRTSKREHVIENFKSLTIKVNDEDLQSVISDTPRKYCWDPSTVA
uniref:Aldo_ket_red domain-containing protein n=1 Tax=Gongylonema pulchrum TaxID=637853 RepID=A0A183DV49_9BILA